ncbi:hypothetical protein SAMN02745221_00779 [Thermosyntropha lipolytica DSM 11003]|uniref:Uncharacterized protein n=1 Tax=Thermosyntropha lipolytica DSM 11003 TaxID=1123382 RepID=A0A1M5LXG6_9FIRM|nr:hypothetical protein [Thermosyntropha lipolytica]SHG69630.1 hypothetical protein SAMN02745221_00779 [Thermosyntropha lipolytica DSM 11003]
MYVPYHNNTYTFQPFLEWRKNVDYYADDPFIHKVIKCYVDNINDKHASLVHFFRY